MPEISPLLSFSQKTTPCFKLLGQGVLCALESHGKIVPYQHRASVIGGAAAQSDLLWPESPLGLALRPPYLVSLLLSSIAVHNVTDYQHYQSLQILPGQHALVSDTSPFLLLFGNAGFSLVHFKPVESQVAHLLAHQRPQEGLDLFAAIASGDPDYRRRLLDVNRDAGYAFFAQMQFQRAFQLWFDSSVDPLDVIALFPGLLPDAFRHATPAELRPSEGIPRTPLVQVLHTALEPTAPQEQKRRELASAQQHLLTFLENYLLSHHCAQQDAVYLVILRLYLDARPDKLFAFFTPAHPLPFAEARACLEARGFHHAVGRLCEAAGELREALQIWRRIGLQELQDSEPRVTRSSALNSTISLLSLSLIHI